MLTVWTETCQPASFARPMVSVRSAGSQLKIVPQPLSRWIFRPWTRRRSSTGPGSRSAYQSPRSSVVGVQGEVGVDPERQGVVGGQGLELVEALRVDPLLADRGPAAAEGRVHRLGRRIDAVVLAVADPVGVGVDEPGVGHVLADVDDRHLVTGERQHLVPGADGGDRPVLDEQGLRDGRLVHGHDPADDDEAPPPVAPARRWRR